MFSGIGGYGFIQNFPIEPDPQGDPSSLKNSIRKQAEIHERVKRAFQNSWSKTISKYEGRSHSFSSVVEKQVEIILSQLKHPWNIDFRVLKNDDQEEKKDQDDGGEKKEKNKKLITKIGARQGGNLKLGKKAGQAIALSAQSWVQMRNLGLLRMAKKFLSEPETDK